MELGTLAKQSDKRDAVHVACEPRLASEKLVPGQWVDDWGIVDPFLTKPVEPGQWYWYCVKPGLVTTIRHEWTAINESKLWIEDFAASINQTYDSLMDAADKWCSESWGYTYDNTEAYKESAEVDWEAFWIHFEALTGRTPNEKTCFFTCSC